MGDRGTVDGVTIDGTDRCSPSIGSLGTYCEAVDSAGGENHSPHVGTGRVLPSGKRWHSQLSRGAFLFKGTTRVKLFAFLLRTIRITVTMFVLQLADHTNALSTTDSVSVQVYVCAKMRAKIVSEVNANVDLLQVCNGRWNFWALIRREKCFFRIVKHPLFLRWDNVWAKESGHY